MQGRNKRQRLTYFSEKNINSEETINHNEFTSLPAELIAQIISHLDVKSILRLRRTCSFFYKHGEIQREIKKYEIHKLIMRGSIKNKLFIITKKGEVFTNGSNLFGELGLGDTANRDLPTLVNIPGEKIIQVDNGFHHTIFLTESGKLYSCGANHSNQLGFTKEATEIYFPNQICPYLHTPTLITSLEGKEIEKIACGNYFSAFLTREGEVLLCGSICYSNPSIPHVLKTDNKKITDIACGGTYLHMLTDKGEVYSTGSSYLGGIGQYQFKLEISKKLNSLADKKIMKICCGENFSVFVTDQQEVYVTGRNDKGELGLGNHKDQYVPVCNSALTNKNIINAFCGVKNIFFISTNGEVYASGKNEKGELGLGDKKNRDTPTRIESFGNKKIIDIVPASSFTIFLTDQGLYVSGRNHFRNAKLVKDQGDNILTPTLMRNPILDKDELIGSEELSLRPS